MKEFHLYVKKELSELHHLKNKTGSLAGPSVMITIVINQNITITDNIQRGDVNKQITLIINPFGHGASYDSEADLQSRNLFHKPCKSGPSSCAASAHAC